MTRESAATFGALGFLFGLILGLASCSTTEACVQPAAVAVTHGL